MPELEDQLLALGKSIAWPATPQLRIVRTNRLFEEPAPRIVRTNRRFVLAAAAVLLIVAALAFTWIGLHTTIYRVPNLPVTTPRSPGVLGSNLGLGTPTTLAGAQSRVRWKVMVPASLGRPDAVYIMLPPTGPSGGEVTLVYAHAPGIAPSAETGVAVLVTEARGTVAQIYFQKTLGPGTTLEQVTVGDRPGYWISGHPHDFGFVTADGYVLVEPLRLATNTLIVDLDGTVVRIEGDMTKDQALAIAGTLAAAAV